MFLTNTIRLSGESCFSFSLPLIALALPLTLLPSAQAALRTWTGGSASGNWSQPANWSGGVPQHGDDLSFPGGLPAADLLSTNDLASLRLQSITFSGASGGYALRGNAITLTNGISSANTAGDNDVDFDITLGLNQTFVVTTGGTLDVNGDINLSGRTLTINGAFAVRLDGAIIGTGNLVKNGVGSLTLGGLTANTFAGNTTLNAGTLFLSKAAGITSVPGNLFVGDGGGADLVQLLTDNQIANTATVTIQDTAELDLNNNDDTIGSLVMTGGTINTGTGILILNGNLTANASVTQANITGNLSLGSATRTFDVGAGIAAIDMLISAVISGTGGIIKNGGGELRLSGANTYTGATTINDGTLAITVAAALGGTANGTAVTDGGTLWLINVLVGAEDITLTNATLLASGVSSLSGDITLNSFFSSINVLSGGTFTHTGVVSGAGGLRKGGGGTLQLAGITSNSYSGDTHVTGGVLELNKPIAANAVSAGDLTIGDNIGGSGADVVRLLQASQIPNGTPITINSSGLLDLNGFNDTVGALTFSGGGDITTGAGTLFMNGNVAVQSPTNTAIIIGNLSLGSLSRTFNVADGTADPEMSISAVISSSAPGAGIIKTGPGELQLSGANTYGGPTTINAGILSIESDSALGGVSSGTTVNTNAALFLGIGANNVPEPLTLNGSGPSQSGALQAVGGVTWETNIVLASDSSINVQSASVLTIDGIVSGANDLTKIGGGQLTLGGTSPNTYSGVTLVADGVLLLNKVGGQAVVGDLIIGDRLGGAGTATARLAAINQIANTSDVFINNDGGLNLDSFNDAIGSLAGSGSVTLGAALLFTGANNNNTLYAGVISGTGGFIKQGTGTMTLNGDNTYTGFTTVQNGTLLVNGDQHASPVQVNTTGTLGGGGIVGNISDADGNVRPGTSPDILTCSNLVFASSGDLFVELNGSMPGIGYDQLNVRGTNGLGNATLHVSLGFPPAEAERFTILNNDASEAINGIFAGLPNGTVFTVNDIQFRILYNGGSGNDVQLVVTNTPLRLASFQVPTGGNGNSTFEPNECNLIFNFIVTNVIGAPVTGVSATLVPHTDGVSVTQPFSPYPDMPINGRGTNLVPFQVSTLPNFRCGTNLSFDLVLETAAFGTFRIPINYGLPNSGMEGPPRRFDNNTPVAIPDLGMVDSTILVSGIDTPIRKVVVSLHITHTAVDDLDISLIGPSGTTVNLSSDNGGAASDYGTSCVDTQRTTFDSSGPFPLITSASAPFVGRFQPEVTLLAFFGDFGADVNGTWTLRMADDAGGAVGTLRCWSLFISPTVCPNGGGACESCPERTFLGSISTSSQVQDGRLFRDGNESACGTNKLCPGPTSVGSPRFFDAYTFQNGESDACITVVFNPDCDLFCAAYTNSYNPSNVCENYLADPGASPLSGNTNTYLFRVGAGARFVIVVNQATASAFCGYRLDVSGGSCRPVLDIARASGNRVVLDWTTAAIGYSLERTNTLSDPSASAWQAATPAPVIINSRFQVTNNTTGAANFYRLRKP